ncbi:MAG: phage integrase [Betaproteobacteria bacterium]|nr:phage integrase [Betaproteobacteria bacterium]
MARAINKLSAKQVQKLRHVAGYHNDGGNLYLQGGAVGSWVFRYTLRGRPKTAQHARDHVEMGLGSLLALSIVAARERAAEYRRLLADKLDPVTVRDQRRAQHAVDAAKAVLFKKCAESYVDAHRASWKNGKHGDQWTNTLTAYAFPEFGAMPVQSVDTGLVLKALDPIWKTKHETATRVRSRIEAVLDWASSRGYRSGENPARWKGHLENLLPKIEKRKRVKHHAALPFNEIGDFLVALRAQAGVAARALELVILTATRTADARGARWTEVDTAAAVWTIPAARMKAHREHRVPLSPRAVTVIKAMEALRDGDIIFPGGKRGQPLSVNGMLALLERMDRGDLTVHGFRSTFRDWAAERTNYAREVCEAALAHVVGDQTEAAYRRGDLFDKRRALMTEWARFCESPKRGDVIPLRAKKEHAK